MGKWCSLAIVSPLVAAGMVDGFETIAGSVRALDSPQSGSIQTRGVQVPVRGAAVATLLPAQARLSLSCASMLTASFSRASPVSN